jgi:nucleoside-diphosphate-sugar epimerase
MKPPAKIAVTGGSGKAGRGCIRDLLDHGYDVFNIDQSLPTNPACPSLVADLADFGQTLDALSTNWPGRRSPGAPFDAIVHLAAIPASRRFSDSVTFQNNTMSTYHVFEAARRLGIRNVVWASSETVLGLPFEIPPPYAPLDENDAPRPESAYSLSKVMGEEMAKQFCRWDPTMKIIGLRLSNVMEPEDYARFAGFQTNAQLRRWNLWGYIDVRDAAQAIRKAIEAPLTGAEVFVIANSNTVMERPSADLLAEVFPEVPIKKALARNETLLSIEKAQRLLGFAPQYDWI